MATYTYDEGEGTLRITIDGITNTYEHTSWEVHWEDVVDGGIWIEDFIDEEHEEIYRIYIRKGQDKCERLEVLDLLHAHKRDLPNPESLTFGWND